MILSTAGSTGCCKFSATEAASLRTRSHWETCAATGRQGESRTEKRNSPAALMGWAILALALRIGLTDLDVLQYFIGLV